MRIARKRITLLLARAVFLTVVTSAALAQTGEGYDLSWWTVDAGGRTLSTGEGYTLGGSVGQPDAGLLTGGNYTVGGGFWGGGVMTRGFQIYLPLTLREH